MVAPRVHRRLAAILTADVVGYSRLMERDEHHTLERLRRHRQEFLEPLVAEQGGRVVKLMGDSVLCEFPSAVDAVRCAVLLQGGMAEREAGEAQDDRLRFRIGINLGDVVCENGDIFGDGVNIAARLEQLAEPGGVCIARNVHNQIRGKLPFRFLPMGRRRIKNIAEPVEVWRVLPEGAGNQQAHRPARWRPRSRRAAAVVIVVALAAIGGWWHLAWIAHEAGGPPLPDKPSIAVLPFDALGGEGQPQRFAAGLTEDLITNLARSRHLLVIARNSVEAFRGKATDVRQVGRTLGVRYVLEGSLQLPPNQVRVTAQLIDAATGAHLWSERYDRPAGDLFAVRDEVLTRLVGTLTGYDGPIWAEWTEAARHRPPDSLRAWDYFLLATKSYRRHDPAGNAEARRLLGEALRLDPRFASAWRFLADTHLQDAINGWSGDRAGSWASYHEAVRQAAELDPTDPQAQLSLGTSYFKQGEVELGSAAWERALALGPNDALVHRLIGAQLAEALGVERAAEAVALVERALTQLDPLHPPYHWLSLACPLYFAGRYPEAIAALEKIPGPWLHVRVMLAVSLAQAGLEAAAQAREVLRLDPGFSAEGWIDNGIFRPGGSAAALFIAGARRAGLPLCATVDAAVRFAPGNRLAECEAERAWAAARRSWSTSVTAR
jgi:class 3 adenylate cyclase/TolB-like protein/Tfp pilus assembly protein PilF